MKKSNTLLALIPILFGFFVMGFVDMSGTATSYAKADFGLSEGASGWITFVAFFWFLILSVPTALIMNKIGRKTTVLISMAVTVVGMMIPYFHWSLSSCLIAVALLGIGNTILQVSLNPLLTNVVSGKVLPSALTGGQVAKAVSSLVAPYILAYASSHLGGWHMTFTVYAVVTLIVGLWLVLAPIQREEAQKTAGISETFSLLKDRTILLLFLGIVAVVGVDVGLNTISSKLLMQVLNLNPDLQTSVEAVKHAPSTYFLCRTIGAFLGTWLLLKIAPINYFRISILLCILGVAGLFFAGSETAVLGFVGLIGFAASCIFSVIFGMALNKRPEKANEISGLMITGVFGGAVIPPVMAWASGLMGSQSGALIVLLITILYLTFCAFGIKTQKAQA